TNACELLTAGAASTRPGLPGRLAVAITRRARTCPPNDRLYRRSTWLEAPSSGSTPTRATASSPRTTEPPTCSSITLPSRLTASAACRRTSGSPTPPGGGRRVPRPRKSARSDRKRVRPGILLAARPGLLQSLWVQLVLATTCRDYLGTQSSVA